MQGRHCTGLRLSACRFGEWDPVEFGAGPGNRKSASEEVPKDCGAGLGFLKFEAVGVKSPESKSGTKLLHGSAAKP